MGTDEFYIEFTLDDDLDDTEAFLSVEEARMLGLSIGDRLEYLDDEWIVWN